MGTKAEDYQYQLDAELILCDRTISPLPIHALALALTKLEEDLIECRLRFQINAELHRRIETEALFNLKPEIRVPLSSEDFLSETDIEIEISLQPDFLPNLSEHIASLDEISSNFIKLNQEQPDNPLFATENWLLVSAIQPQTSSDVGYRTLWDYLSPATLSKAAASGSANPISDALGTFFKNWTQNNLSAVTEQATAEVVDGIAHFFRDLADFNLDELKKLVKNIDQQVTKDWKPFSGDRTILQEMLNFFTEDDWNFRKLQGESVLQVAFGGKNGKWNCYAKAIEENKQFIFYSLCPITAPEDKRQAIAEFLTRANYAMMIGNFELDFSDGEIRYKTSIDIAGDRLSFALIKNLVYTNVTMMDEYLPGILLVIDDDASPQEAITKIETNV
ncbi:MULTISPECIES: type III secretion system chaperone family protein [Nostoc]|uniref:YbjN domain-containing protein n=2 Tax=Nostoc TaxID=1177 RepID=A0ABR8I9P0_9NOSO|nr:MULTISPECIES: YbjN domain-containing protein [Nostoc]MBD2563676.1 YbjN domain-containing protein [Nostoc linckia FACHB-391]MBD2647175.1 YbjN domain-containing protein [Nostoc foliaceum FACHB-393]